MSALVDSAHGVSSRKLPSMTAAIACPPYVTSTASCWTQATAVEWPYQAWQVADTTITYDNRRNSRHNTASATECGGAAGASIARGFSGQGSPSSAFKTLTRSGRKQHGRPRAGSDATVVEHLLAHAMEQHLPPPSTATKSKDATGSGSDAPGSAMSTGTKTRRQAAASAAAAESTNARPTTAAAVAPGTGTASKRRRHSTDCAHSQMSPVKSVSTTAAAAAAASGSTGKKRKNYSASSKTPRVRLDCYSTIPPFLSCPGLYIKHLTVCMYLLHAGAAFIDTLTTHMPHNRHYGVTAPSIFNSEAQLSPVNRYYLPNCSVGDLIVTGGVRGLRGGYRCASSSPHTLCLQLVHPSHWHYFRGKIVRYLSHLDLQAGLSLIMLDTAS